MPQGMPQLPQAPQDKGPPLSFHCSKSPGPTPPWPFFAQFGWAWASVQHTTCPRCRACMHLIDLVPKSNSVPIQNVRKFATSEYIFRQGKGRECREVRRGNTGRSRAPGGERPMGTATTGKINCGPAGGVLQVSGPLWFPSAPTISERAMIMPQDNQGAARVPTVHDEFRDAALYCTVPSLFLCFSASAKTVFLAGVGRDCLCLMS